MQITPPVKPQNVILPLDKDVLVNQQAASLFPFFVLRQAKPARPPRGSSFRFIAWM